MPALLPVADFAADIKVGSARELCAPLLIPTLALR